MTPHHRAHRRLARHAALALLLLAGTAQADLLPCTEQGIRDAIALGGGPHTFACPGPVSVATASEIVIDRDVILDGGGALTVDAGGGHRVFSVAAGVAAELHGLTVTGGDAAQGGGIFNAGSLVVARCEVTGNAADLGGGLFNDYQEASLVLRDSVVSDNVASAEGGGVYNSGGLATVGTTRASGTTIAGNVADQGGGLYNDRATVYLSNTTISGNAALSWGGGLRVPPRRVPACAAGPDCRRLTASNVTISGNTAALGAAAIAGGSDITLTLANTLIDGDCADPYGSEVPLLVDSRGGNLESPGNTCGLTQPGDQVNVAPPALALGALAANGGPTPTHALLAGSAAVDAALGCPPPDADQRGVGRPQGLACDVGAYELGPPCGDAVLEFPEECDDGNVVPGDGCDAACRSEAAVVGGLTVVIEDNGDGTFDYVFSDADGVPVIVVAGNEGLIDLSAFQFDEQGFLGGRAVSIAGLDLTGATKSVFLPFSNLLCAVDDPSFLSGGALAAFIDLCLLDPDRIVWSPFRGNACGEPGTPVAGQNAAGEEVAQVCERFLVDGETLARMSGFVHTTVASLPFVPATIDIRPHRSTNFIHPPSWRPVPVAVLGSDVFDVVEVDVASLAFGPAGAPPVKRVCSRSECFATPFLADVNDDGLADLVSHYRPRRTGIAFGDTEACLVGRTHDGTRFQGCDAVRTVPPCGLGVELVLLGPLLAWLHRRRRRGAGR